MTQQTYPCVIAAIPDDGTYLVALDQDWGRILNRDRQQYWPTGLIGTHLVMTGPWEFLAPDVVSPAMLAEWVAQAHDVEADLTPEQRAHRVASTAARRPVLRGCAACRRHRCPHPGEPLSSPRGDPRPAVHVGADRPTAPGGSAGGAHDGRRAGVARGPGRAAGHRAVSAHELARGTRDGDERGSIPPASSLLAPHLQGWRLHRGLTSMDLAARAGVSFGAISRAENGRPIRRATLARLAHVLDTPVETLLAVEAPPPPPDAALALRTRTRARVPYQAAPIRQPQRSDPLYLRQLASFPTWLLAQQHRPDRIGAIARVADADHGVRRLAAQGAPTGRPTAPDLREAWATWGRWRRNQLRHHTRPVSARKDH